MRHLEFSGSLISAVQPQQDVSPQGVRQIGFRIQSDGSVELRQRPGEIALGSDRPSLLGEHIGRAEGVGRYWWLRNFDGQFGVGARYGGLHGPIGPLHG